MLHARHPDARIQPELNIFTQWLRVVTRQANARCERLGGEVLVPVDYTYYTNAKDGLIEANLGPAPANIEDLFPVWNVPRNNFVGKPLHRVDLRVQRRFPLPGGASVDGIVEVFYLFNHANHGSYVTDEASRAYGRPVQNQNVAYQPRMMQLGFRVEF